MPRLLRALCAASVAVWADPTPSFAETPTALPSLVVEAPKPAAARKRRPRTATAQARRPSTTRPAIAAPPPLSSRPVQATTAGPVQGYRALTAGSATRTDTPLMQLPQSIQVVPRRLIDDQAAVSVSEAAQNVSNVQPVNPLVVANADQLPLKIRGFGAEQWRDGLVNLYNVGDRDGLINVERIEVLKGPNAILYGGGAGAPAGGTLNVISKLPTDRASSEVGVRFGSYQFWNPFIDINRPLNAENTALFRITGEYTGNRSDIDVLESGRYNINPTLTLTNRTDTTLTIQGHVSRQQQQAYQGLPVGGTLLGDFQVRRDLFIGPATIPPSHSSSQGVTVTLDHRFDDVWSANVKARWSRSVFDQLSQNAVGGDPAGALPALAPSTWLLQNVEMFQQQQEFTINPSVQAKFTLGESHNTLLLGADYSHVRDRGFMTADSPGACPQMTADPAACPPAAVDLSAPVFAFPFARPAPGSPGYMAMFDFSNRYTTEGLYAQLQSSLFDRVHLLAGGRLAHIDISYTENALAQPGTFVTDATRLLPRAGIVVDLVQGLSAYAGYGEGMRWAGFSSAVTRPAPELSRQGEVGLKFNLNDTLSGSVAAFEIHRDNVPVTIALGVAGLTRQMSRGVEGDLVWQPNRNWSVLASYGYTEATFADAFWDFSGGQIPSGNRLPAVPAHTGRVWANYKFDPGPLQGWSIGAGVYAASRQYVDSANRWSSGGYFTVDAKIAYETERFRASLTVKNLTGERYLVPYAWLGGQVAPGAPRMVYGQISYLFN